MPPPHNGICLAEKILLLMKDWDLDKKVMCLTLDNASSNDLCVGMLKSQFKLYAMVSSFMLDVVPIS